MKVTMKNAVVKTLIGCLEEMSNRHTKLPVKIWYALSYNRKKLDSAEKITESARIKLVEQYGELDEKSGAMTVTKESGNHDKFMKGYADLLDLEVEIEVRKLSISDLENAMDKMEGVQGTFAFFEHLVIEEPESDKEAGELKTKKELEKVD